MSTDIHFEIYVKKNRKTGWALCQALSSREEALRTAKAQLETLPNGSVRVTKESFNDSQNSFLSIAIFEEGEERHTRTIRADNKMEPPCASPDDLYAVHTRRMMGRALAPWLKQNNVCALELLHRSDLAEKLAAAGHDRQHAIQKIAIAQAGALECSVQHIVRRLTELADAATDQLRLAKQQNRIAAFDDKGFAATLARIKEHKEPGFALCSALASRLANMGNWPDKVSFLASCVSDALVESEGESIGLAILDSFLAEIVTLPDALDICAGGEEAGDRLDRITDILCGKPPEHANKSAHLLTTAISSGELPETQSALVARVFKELRGPRRLYPDRFKDEIELNRSLANRLVRLPQGLAPPDQLSEAFIIRSSRLLETSAIERLLSTADNPGDEILMLIDFEQSMVGDHNKQKLADFLQAIISAHKTERWFCKEGGHAFRRLSVGAQAQKLVLNGSFCKEDKQSISTALDRLCHEAMKQSKAFEKIERQNITPMQKAIILLKLPDQGLVTMGNCSDEANRRAKYFLRTSSTRNATENDSPEHFKELSGLLLRAKAHVA